MVKGDGRHSSRVGFAAVTHRVTILPRAKRQLLEQALWWAEHRSAEQAFRWLDGFEHALTSLADRPERCSVARESNAFDVVLPELHYGLRNKRSEEHTSELQSRLHLV